MAVDFGRNAYRKRWFNHANYTVIGCCQKQCDFGSATFANSNNKKDSSFFFSLVESPIIILIVLTTKIANLFIIVVLFHLKNLFHVNRKFLSKIW